MDENVNSSEEIQVVAEPETEIIEGGKAPEVAEPEVPNEPVRNFEADAAYAQMRRHAEQLEEENRRKEEALRLFFDDEDPTTAALAYAQGKTQEQVIEELKEKERLSNLERENEALKRENIRVAATVAMSKDLTTVQTLDPTIKSLDELGSTFMNLIATGNVSAEEAYYAAKAKIQKETKLPPGEIGAINSSFAEKDFYTKDEVDAMLPEEVSKNYEKIRKSMSKWK